MNSQNGDELNSNRVAKLVNVLSDNHQWCTLAIYRLERLLGLRRKEIYLRIMKPLRVQWEQITRHRFPARLKKPGNKLDRRWPTSEYLLSQMTSGDRLITCNAAAKRLGCARFTLGEWVRKKIPAIGKKLTIYRLPVGYGGRLAPCIEKSVIDEIIAAEGESCSDTIYRSDRTGLKYSAFADRAGVSEWSARWWSNHGCPYLPNSRRIRRIKSVHRNLGQPPVYLDSEDADLIYKAIRIETQDRITAEQAAKLLGVFVSRIFAWMKQPAPGLDGAHLSCFLLPYFDKKGRLRKRAFVSCEQVNKIKAYRNADHARQMIGGRLCLSVSAAAAFCRVDCSLVRKWSERCAYLHRPLTILRADEAKPCGRKGSQPGLYVPIEELNLINKNRSWLVRKGWAGMGGIPASLRDILANRLAVQAKEEAENRRVNSEVSTDGRTAKVAPRHRVKPGNDPRDAWLYLEHKKGTPWKEIQANLRQFGPGKRWEWDVTREALTLAIKSYANRHNLEFAKRRRFGKIPR